MERERANMSFMNEADFRPSLFGSAVTLLHFNKTVILVRKKTIILSSFFG